MSRIYQVPSHPDCVIERGPIEVPDNEHGTVATYRGARVLSAQTGACMGHLWRDHERMCWRTLDEGHYGRELSAHHAITNILMYRRRDGYAA